MKSKHKHIIGISAFLLLSIFLTFNRHGKTGYFNYKSEIWADKAGFYIYLPAVIKYDLDPTLLPDSIDKKLGNGFQLDFENNKIRNKYTCGVAIMQLPFYLIADILAKPLGYKADGFSPIYHWSVNLASIFYMFFGLIFIKRFLKTRYSEIVSYLVPLVLFFGTNLYFYSIDETGMSHVYSFFLFSALLSFLDRTKFLSKLKYYEGLLLGIMLGLIVLIRPTNLLIFSAILFIDTSSKEQIVKRFKYIIPKLLPIILGGVLIILPQLLYWKYLHGSYIFYSYGDEGFNWSNPELILNWFSTKNGLFLYTPMYFLFVFSLILMIKNKVMNAWYILILFLTISYILSSWWDWSFGCSFGARSYVEYLVIFSIPLAYVFESVKSMKRSKIIGFGIFIVFLIFLNLYQSYSYDNCFYGDYWDWSKYFEFISS